MNKWSKVSILAGAALLTGSLYFTNVSWAQSGSDPAPTTVAETTAPTDQTERPDRGGLLFSREEKQAMLAEALGMPVAELQKALASGQKLREIVQTQGLTRESFHAALGKVADKHLQQAVADGRITQQQADRVQRRMVEGKGRWGQGERRGEQAPWRRALHAEGQVILAETLGMTPEALQKSLTAGQTPLELAQAKGMNETTFHTALQQAAEKHLQQAVKDGRITQAQADRIRARLADQRRPWQWLRAWGRQQR